jgi:DNA-binding CsgD family transcriptional regulator
LTDRHAERGVLDRLAQAVRDGESRTLVVYGEAGTGKTALLDYLAAHSGGSRVARADGIQSDMELPFAGVHQLCGHMTEHLGNMPRPQRHALLTAFGINAGPAPDRFLISLAVLSLLSQVAAENPLLCIIDDYQWLDRASAQVLAFVARRLGTESLGLLFATRHPDGDLAGLPELAITGLQDSDARVLLEAVLGGPIDSRVEEQIIAETRGNPLALLELPRWLPREELAGGFGLPSALPAGDSIAGSVEQNFRRRIAALPGQARRLLLLAAADPSGDPALVWRAAIQSGVSTGAAAPATESGLAEFGTRLLFRHPLARSAAYQSASARDRRAAHQALAAATDPVHDPDRRAWHRAQATPGPDEDIAAELEHSASRARARGGVSAAAAFLERSAALTLDPTRRAERALAAAQAKIQAGAISSAQDLLAMTGSEPLSDFQHAHADLTQAQLAFVTSRGPEAPPLLLSAARRLEHIDPGLSRAAYLDALSAAIFAGRLARPGGDVLATARAAAGAPPSGEPRAPDFLLDGLTTHYNHSFAAGVPMIRKSLARFGDGMTPEEELHWLWLTCVAGAFRVWDDARWDTLSARYVQLARDTGSLGELPLALTLRCYVHLFAGELSTAETLIQELQAVQDATGIGLAPYAALGHAAFRGEDSRALALVEATMKDVTKRGEGVGITFAQWATALLNNGLGRYDQAAAAARHACGYEDDLGALVWTLPELIEAATRTGMTDAAHWARARLEEMTSATRTDWALGIRARCLALLTTGDTAEHHYRDAITRLARTPLRTDHARAHLLYGEWLRRQRRRADARAHLRTAHTMFQHMNMTGFAARASQELASTGETARKRTPDPAPQHLTPQETLIARLARDGLSNPEIGTRLFLSPHTVQYHLRKIFTKLSITSRTQLGRALPADTTPT